jgi:hypothetical protein
MQEKQTYQPIIIASHPRSGTHLTIDLLRRQFASCSARKYPGQSLGSLYCTIENWLFKDSTAKDIAKGLDRFERPLIKTHLDPDLTPFKRYPQLHDKLTTNTHKFYVVRDGRQVLCSLHLYMQSFDPIARCSLSSFLRQNVGDVSRVQFWANHVKSWITKPGVKVIKFEQLISNTERVLDYIGSNLGELPSYQTPLLPPIIKSVWHSRWLRLTSMNPGSTAIIGHYKGQKTQKWQTAFTPQDYEFFHQEAGDLLLELGYISSDT